MKKKISSLIIICLSLMLSGCVGLSFFSNKERPGYNAGVLAATTYVATKGIQSESVNTAIKASYYTLVRITGGESESDYVDIIMEEVSKLITDKTSDDKMLRDLSIKYFITAKEKLYDELGDLNSKGGPLDNKYGEIFANFRAGIDFIVADTQPSGVGIQW